MGGKNSTVIDPNSTTQNQNNNGAKSIPQGEIEKIMQIIQQAFRNVSQSGVLTRDKFNQALSILEVLGFKRLRDTPLADRLYYIFDKGSTGQISQKEFSNGIRDIISDKENAVNYSFRAIDKDRDNMISRKEFMLFVEQSWKSAFRMVSESLDSTKQGIRIVDIQNWTASKISLLNEQSSQLFNLMSGGGDKADYQSYRNFTMKDYPCDITAELDGAKAVVPLNLCNLH